jgi:hypothetical protein
MAAEWIGHKQGLVASVDFTQEEEWCVSMGISGFPTLLFGDPSQGGVFLETYSGDKTYEALSEFANETLKRPVCSPANPKVCDDSMREKIEKMWIMTVDELGSAIEEQEQLAMKAEKDFQDAFEMMQVEYDKHSQEHEMLLANMKSNVKLLRSFLKNGK